MSIHKIITRVFLISTIYFLSSCAGKNAPEIVETNDEAENTSLSPELLKQFDDYWYAGKAELCTYELNQARYGELHPGTEVLIFVTEDYNMDKQVKKESASEDAYASILKLNSIKRFTTGIYDYSMMTSVFKAIDTKKHPRAFKINSSSQDWCGQTWTNLVWDEKNGYRQHLDSYFESEVSDDKNIANVMSEDEVMTQIRLNPRNLPQGKFRMIPSVNHARFSHQELKAEEVSGRLILEVKEDNSEEYIYTLIYTSGRTITYHFQSVFPFRISGWEEKSKSGYGEDAKWLTSTATLKNSINTDYWAKHDLKDGEMRKLLGL